ncbi:hypothetical protein AB0N19_25615, partial [Streptomyces sp. NPDC051132]|uniref:hypothetical protein n=1 Tax=Streptomyces sp. NPDC051132 TaxID=3155667 RepID=UPI0034456564
MAALAGGLGRARSALVRRGPCRGQSVGAGWGTAARSAALRQLQYFWPKAVGGVMPRLVDRKVQLVA